MRKIQFITFVLLALISSVSLQAQQRSIYSQYMFNGLTINPAYSATDMASNLSLHHRQQWVGLDGAPQTTTLSFYTPTGYSSLSLGGLVAYDRIGANSQSEAAISAAFKVDLTEEVQLAAGLNIGVANGGGDLHLLPPTDDPLFARNERNLDGIVGAGLMLYSNSFYLGVSAPQLQNITFREVNNGLTESKFKRHYYVAGGYLINISDDFKLKPNFLMRFVEGSQPQYDINLSAQFLQRLWLGVSYRTLESINILAQYEFSPKFQLTYSYDVLTSVSGKVSSGSHEIMLSYRFMMQRQNVMGVRGWF